MSDLPRPTGREIIERLKTGKLPQMVDWFDPLILGMVAVRTVISSTIGEYADQRPMQEAADGQRDMERLTQRHDYSAVDLTTGLLLPPEGNPKNPYYPKDEELSSADPDDQFLMMSRRKRRLQLDGGGLWVDFIADLGDGFEATYAMAYLLAREQLEVEGVPEKMLPAGQILILGGDLAYPNATEEEYRKRCLEPYDWAFPFTPNLDKLEEREPKRELFFIAGNHDWYDGLAAFSNQFCYETTAVGGWRCSQQRSYFALKLPYDWWIWGIDVALGDSLDVAQRHYFQAVVSKQFKDEVRNKVIIVLHAPDWQKREYRALSMICQLARTKGEVCAIIAGDLHHYSRYESQKEMRTPEMHLITSGGGGAFAHPTHDQKREFKVRHEVAGTGKAKPLVHETSKQELPAGDPRREPDEISFRASRRQFYPSKARSRLLALRNLLLPFHNWRFAAFLGVVYALFAWVFQIAVADPTVAIRNAQHVSIEMKCLVDNPGNSDRADLCSTAKRRAFDRKLSELTAPGATALSPSSGGKSMQGIEDEVEARLDRWLSVVEEQGGWWSYLWSVLSVQFSPDRVLGGMLASPFFFLLVAGLWIGLVQYASVSLAIAWLRWPIKLIIGTTHATAHLTVLLATNSILMIVYESFAESQSFVVKLAGTGLYAFLMVLIGGILGALVFGVYWVITSVLFGMHQDSFSALGVKKYKNFLRMKFEENKVTIYPIALDKVPNRWGWRESEEGKAGKGSLIEPKKKMRPRLIEGPITIDRDAYVPPI